MKIDIRFALVVLIIGVIYASFVAPITVKEKIVKSTETRNFQDERL